MDIWSEYHGWQEILSDIAAADASLTPEIGMRRSTGAAAEALRHEEIDLAFGIPSGITLPTGLDTTPVRIRPCGLLLPGGHRFAGRDSLSCAELAGTPIRIAPNTPAEVDHAFRSLATRFGAVPVDGGLNLGLLHALGMFAQDPDLAIVFPVGANLPPGANARIVPLTDPEPCLLWSLIWRSGDGNPRLSALLRTLTKLAAEEGWLSFNSERQWLLGTLTA